MKIVPTVFERSSAKEIVAYQYTYAHKVRLVRFTFRPPPQRSTGGQTGVGEGPANGVHSNETPPTEQLARKQLCFAIHSVFRRSDDSPKLVGRM